MFISTVNTRCMSIYSFQDWTIWPGPSALVEDPKAINIELDQVGHVGLLYDERVFDFVKKHMGQKAKANMNL